ncbi:MAG: tetratricopeptide repeat protein, partial [Acidobacteriota bacterium]
MTISTWLDLLGQHKAVAILMLLSSILLVPASTADELESRERSNGQLCRSLSVQIDEASLRWADPADSMLPTSNYPPHRLLSEATEDERLAGQLIIDELSTLPKDARRPHIAAWLSKHLVLETVLWIPARIIQRQFTTDSSQALRSLSAWIDILEEADRRDILLSAASDLVDLCAPIIGSSELIARTDRWLASVEEVTTIGEAHLLKSYARLAEDEGNLLEALEALRRAQSVFEHHEDLLGLANAVRRGARILFLLGLYDLALSEYDRAHAIYESSGSDPRGLANVWSGVSSVHAARNELALAMKARETSLDFFKILGDRGAIAGTRLQIGDLAWLEEDYETA